MICLINLRLNWFELLSVIDYSVLGANNLTGELPLALSRLKNLREL
jgi:hypothetical protein